MWLLLHIKHYIFTLGSAFNYLTYFHLGAIPFLNSYFGSGSGPIWLDFVSCDGEEENLLNCSHNGFGVTSYYCDHLDDVGVQCPGT